MFGSIVQVKRANEKAGQHFFSESSMRFFGSKVESMVYPAFTCAYFITSEQDPEGKAWFGERRYTIRAADPNGIVTTCGEFGQFFTLDEARLTILDIIRTQGEAT